MTLRLRARLARRFAPCAATLLLAMAREATAGLPTTRLLIADRNPDPAATDDALLAMDGPAGGTITIASAGTGTADFLKLSGLALSPFDGKAYLTDAADETTPGSIRVVDSSGAVTDLVSADPGLPEPQDLLFLPDGRLLVVDWDADPSNLGPDGSGQTGRGHGAIFFVDTTTGAKTLLADGTSHGTLAGVASGKSAFEDPVSLAYDAASGKLYVSDLYADPLDKGYSGAVYSVDVASGMLTLVSTSSDFRGPQAVAVRASGKLLLADLSATAPFAPKIFSLDPSSSDPENNHAVVSDDPRFGALEDVEVDASDKIYAADSGTDDGSVLPTIWSIDESPSVSTSANAVLVSNDSSMLYPVALAPVPDFRLTAVTPSTVPPRPAACAGRPFTARVTGEGLAPDLALSFGPNVAVATPQYGDPSHSGQSLTALLTPTPGFSGTVGLSATRAFLPTPRTLAAALTFQAGTSSSSPAAPCSPRGDANCDGIVDGLDLALLGEHFGAAYCDPTGFYNNADFNNDDLIDGRDLAILAVRFGTTP